MNKARRRKRRRKRRKRRSKRNQEERKEENGEGGDRRKADHVMRLIIEENREENPSKNENKESEVGNPSTHGRNGYHQNSTSRENAKRLTEIYALISGITARIFLVAGLTGIFLIVPRSRKGEFPSTVPAFPSKNAKFQTPFHR